MQNPIIRKIAQRGLRACELCRTPICRQRSIRKYALAVSGIFVSHASADKTLADHFVDDVIRLGSSANRDEIFYSSGEDTGVPSGEDLLSHVRKKVGEASLVVAILTPTFQSRPVSVAELGAAWAQVGKLFPLALPSMQRTDLRGVLEGMTVRYLDDEMALDELHDRIGEALGRPTKVSTWGRYKTKWMSHVDELVRQSPSVHEPTIEEMQRLDRDLTTAREAITELEEELATSRLQFAELAKTRPAEVVRQVALPKDEKAKFEAITSNAARCLHRLPKIVRDAIWSERAVGQMPWPNKFQDQYEYASAEEELRNGLLIETSSEELRPNDQFRKVSEAMEAVGDLASFLDDPSEEFLDWFSDEYGMPPDLNAKRVWDELLG